MGRLISEPFDITSQFRNDRRLFFVPGSYTFIVPSRVYELFGIVIGAGGGGVYDTSGSLSGAAGGGYASGVIPVAPGQSFTVTVGAGGLGSLNSNGNTGGTSSISTFLTATGGGPSRNALSSVAGTGSTSGVSSAYTASGGFSSANSSTYNAYGGCSSGTPISNGFAPVTFAQGNNYRASGGAGWGGSGSVLDSTAAPNNSVGAAGSVGAIGSFAKAASTPASTITGPKGVFLPALTTGNGTTLGLLTGNVTWWFPWEVDGNAGVGYASSASAENLTGRDGGFGSGGGAVVVNGAIAIGGNGGFGAGGGSVSSINATTSLNGTKPGDGGIGGGGGSTTGPSNSGRGGDGGNGCALLYW